MVPVKRADTSEGGRCEHWIKPEHQTCVENVGARHTLFLVGGEYFKQGERTEICERLLEASPEGFDQLHVSLAY